MMVAATLPFNCVLAHLSYHVAGPLESKYCVCHFSSTSLHVSGKQQMPNIT